MELRETEFRKELEQSLEKLNRLAVKARQVLESIELNKNENLIEGLESYKRIVEQEKSLIDWMVIVVNNMCLNQIMDLNEAKTWYSKLYDARKITQSCEEAFELVYE